MLLDPELITRLAPLHLKARTIAEGFIAGLHRSPFHGFSVEFAEHRPYNQGDDFKHIDWKVYGKTERFYVKQFERSEEHTSELQSRGDLVCRLLLEKKKR